MAPHHQVIEDKFYCGANRVSDPVPAWCAVTPLTIELMANNSMYLGDATTSCTPLNFPPTLGLSGILLFPGQDSVKSSMLSFSPCVLTTIFVLLKYTSLEFSVCVLDWELSLTLLWIPSNSHSLLQMRHQKGSVNERRNRLQREEKVWTSIRKGRWFAAGCAGDSWKDTASKFRRQSLKLSIPETKTTCFLLEKD